MTRRGRGSPASPLWCSSVSSPGGRAPSVSCWSRLGGSEGRRRGSGACGARCRRRPEPSRGRRRGLPKTGSARWRDRSGPARRVACRLVDEQSAIDAATDRAKAWALGGPWVDGSGPSRNRIGRCSGHPCRKRRSAVMSSASARAARHVGAGNAKRCSSSTHCGTSCSRPSRRESCSCWSIGLREDARRRSPAPAERTYEAGARGGGQQGSAGVTRATVSADGETITVHVPLTSGGAAGGSWW